MKMKKKHGILAIALTVVSFAVPCAMIVALVVVRTFVVDYYRIPQNGMYPGLPAGSHLLTWRRPYASVSDVRRGDVVVFTEPLKASRYVLIWRVIAIPGDTVEVSDETVVINGAELPKVRLRDEGDFEIFRETNDQGSYEVAHDRRFATKEPSAASLTVPADHLFVLGDNRDDARDSRYHGTVPFSNVIGRKR